MEIDEPIWVNEVRSSTYELADLPATIENEIVDYLEQELAPDFDRNKIELKYVGEFELWGQPIRCWDYGDNEMYATVQPYADNYYIGMTSKAVAG